MQAQILGAVFGQCFLSIGLIPKQLDYFPDIMQSLVQGFTLAKAAK